MKSFIKFIVLICTLFIVYIGLIYSGKQVAESRLERHIETIFSPVEEDIIDPCEKLQSFMEDFKAKIKEKKGDQNKAKYGYLLSRELMISYESRKEYKKKLEHIALKEFSSMKNSDRFVPSQKSSGEMSPLEAANERKKMKINKDMEENEKSEVERKKQYLTQRVKSDWEEFAKRKKAVCLKLLSHYREAGP